jgi:hypothetical protein
MPRRPTRPSTPADWPLGDGTRNTSEGPSAETSTLTKALPRHLDIYGATGGARRYVLPSLEQDARSTAANVALAPAERLFARVRVGASQRLPTRPDMMLVRCHMQHASPRCFVTRQCPFALPVPVPIPIVALGARTWHYPSRPCLDVWLESLRRTGPGRARLAGLGWGVGYGVAES